MIKKVKIVKSVSPLTVKDITNVENQLGISFPSDYRNFLLEFNGGKPTPNAFPLHNNPMDTHALLEWFYCISKGNPYDILRNMQIMKGRIPKNLITIGEDPGGNLICMSVDGDRTGNIFFWDHEGESDQESSESNLYYVAENFDALLESLEDLS